MPIQRIVLTVFAFLAAVAMLVPAPPAAADELETLNKLVAELRKKPDALELRTKIIAHVLNMKTKPAIPGSAERSLIRGDALLKIAKDKSGFEKAIPELQDATNAAPWLGDTYMSLATAQENAGNFADAITSLNYYLLATPKAPDHKDVMKKLYELELFAEQANQTVPAPIKLPSHAAAPASSKRTEGGKSDRHEKAEKPVNPEFFVGSWFGTDKNNPKAEEVSTHAFTIRKSTAGQLNATPPRRAAGTLGSISKFEINGRSLKLQIKYTMSSVPSFWKTEDFDLTLSDDEATLVGTFEQKSSGAKSREFKETDRVFTRQ